jgi:hypothetical protein
MEAMEKTLKRLVVLGFLRDKENDMTSYSIKFFKLIMFQLTILRINGIFCTFSFHLSKIGISIQLDTYHGKGWLI